MIFFSVCEIIVRTKALCGKNSFNGTEDRFFCCPESLIFSYWKSSVQYAEWVSTTAQQRSLRRTTPVVVNWATWHIYWSAYTRFSQRSRFGSREPPSWAPNKPIRSSGWECLGEAGTRVCRWLATPEALLGGYVDPNRDLWLNWLNGHLYQA